MKKLIFLLIALAGISTLRAQEILSLEEAIGTALENNFNIKIAEVSQEIAVNNAVLANAGFMPSIDVLINKTWSTQNVNQTFLNGNTNERDGAASENFGATGSFNWTIFNGKGMFYTLDRLNFEKEASSINTKIGMENTVADVLIAYYTVVLESERLKVLNNSMSLSEKRVEIAKNKYEVGKVSKLEFLAGQVDYNTDKTLVLQEEELFKNAKIDLNRLMARDLRVDFDPESEIDITTDLSLDELLATANVQNPNLLFAQRQMNIAYMQMQEIRAERYPAIDLIANYNVATSSSEANFLILNRATGFTYGLSARINVFDGFSIGRRTQNARLTHKIAELEIKDLTQSIESDMIKIYTSYKNNLNLIDIEIQNLEVAKENEAIAMERYRLGNTTAIELREAQINLVEAESRLLDARYRTKVSEIELLRLSGNLLRPGGM